MSEASCENKLLTVTVPAYNAEGFLRDCLDSLCVPEVLDELEVLVINDGSTDGTAQIAEEYKKRFPNTVRLISKENGGHGSGINCGIANAAGLYFKVVDADDWVERDGFLKLVGTLKELNTACTENQNCDLQKKTGTPGETMDDCLKKTDDCGKTVVDCLKKTDTPGETVDDCLKKTGTPGKTMDDCLKKTDDRGETVDDCLKKTGDRGKTVDDCREKKNGGRQIPDIVCSNFYWAYEKPGIPKEAFERGTELAEPFAGVQYEKIYRFDDIAERLYIKMHNMTIRTEILKSMAEAGGAESGEMKIGGTESGRTGVESAKAGGAEDAEGKLSGNSEAGAEAAEGKFCEKSEAPTDFEQCDFGEDESAVTSRKPGAQPSGKSLRMDEHCFYVDTEYVTYPIPFVETIYFLKEYVYNYRIGRQGQSVGMERMRRNERDYDRVLASLLAFYDRLRAEKPDFPDTELREMYGNAGKKTSAGNDGNSSEAVPHSAEKNDSEEVLRSAGKKDSEAVLRSAGENDSDDGKEATVIRCSAEKKRYISNMIARVIAAKIKIMLSFPASSEKKRELAAFDRKLKVRYPEIYRSNINGAVKALRASGYLLYRPAAWMVKKKYSD